jgi:hypothetical protein
MNRRTFVESSVATGCLHHSSRARAETHRIEKIRVQLYTVRNAMKGRLQQMRPTQEFHLNSNPLNERMRFRGF